MRITAYIVIIDCYRSFCLLSIQFNQKCDLCHENIKSIYFLIKLVGQHPNLMGILSSFNQTNIDTGIEL